MEKLVKVGYKIDGESEVFEGYALEDDGENWNGYAIPFFDRDQLTAFLDNKINEGSDISYKVLENGIFLVTEKGYSLPIPPDFRQLGSDKIALYQYGGCFERATEKELFESRLIAIDNKIVDAAYWVDEGNCSHLVKTEIMQGVIDLAKLILEREELINSYDWDYLPSQDYEILGNIEDLDFCQKLGLEIDERNYKGVEIDR